MIFRILSREEKSNTALLLYRYLIEKAYKDSDIDLSSNADKYYLTVNYLMSKHPMYEEVTNIIDSLVNDGAEMSSIYKVNQINPLSMKEKKALLELLYGYMTEETEEMRITEVEVPDLYKSLINDMINFEIIKRSYCYICTALDKDIVKGDVNDGQ
jgi:regulator of RNase E activity RraB